jgi:hypothetical protein
MFFDKVASISRLIQLQGDSDKEAYSDVAELSGFPVNVQPSNPETVALSNGIFGKTYTIFTKKAGVKDGDRITISGQWIDGVTQFKELQVANVANWWFPPLPHYEITCMEIE